MNELEVQSKKSVIIKSIILILMSEAALFAITGMTCLYLGQLTWNDFFSTLFIIGILTFFVGALFARDIDLADNGFRGQRIDIFTKKYFSPSAMTQQGRTVIGVPSGIYVTIAGLIAILLSIIIPLMFPT